MANLDMATLICEVTKNTSEVMDEKFARLNATLESISNKLDTQAKRITEAEERVSTMEDKETNLEQQLKESQTQIQALTEVAGDMENRNRRDNIRITNLQEGLEGKQPVQFFEAWLPMVIGLEMEKGRIKIDRAHRSLAPRVQRNWPVIIKLHNSRDKLKILSQSRLN